MLSEDKKTKVGDSATMTVVGRIGREPEKKGKLTVASMAVSQRKKDEAGNWVDDITMWFDLTAFNSSLVEVSKGDRVMVWGRLKAREYNGKTYYGIIVETCDLLNRSKPKAEQALPSDDEFPEEDFPA